jgi:hypothetical protein
MKYLRFLLYISVCKISAEMKTFEIYGEEKKNCTCGVSPGHTARDRERCRYVGRDAAF